MQITLTKRDFNSFYINNYFYGQNWTINSMRQFMGPVLTVVGLYLYNYTDLKEKSVYIFWGIVFCLAYGLFYSIKPMILVWALAAKDETFEFKIVGDNLHIKDRVREDTINLRKNKLVSNKKYFIVKLENKQVIFFPKELLDDNTISKFEELI